MRLGLLIPLGLLGLLSIVALIIIWIIKPNYMVKHVSSTHVWKLALKYRRKRLPTSTLRNILLFICQVLILTAMALILSQPALIYDHNTDQSDVIAIIDSSASMYTQTDHVTRFQRAVEQVMGRSDEVISSGGAMSVIIADDMPYYLMQRATYRNQLALSDSLRELLTNKTACFYGRSDVDAAITLCEEILVENPAAKIYLYTDTIYSYVPASVTVVPVYNSEEWNAGILNARAELVDGYYAITVEVACYGRDIGLDVNVQVDSTDIVGNWNKFSKSVYCNSDTVKTVTFRVGGGEETGNFFFYDLGDQRRFSNYKTITVTIDEDDSFTDDNSFYLYGGEKEIITIQYASADPNPFFSTALDIIRSGVYEGIWDIRIDEVIKGKPAQTSGYDFYIYEHTMPSLLPTDGVVLLADPWSAPVGAGFNIINPDVNIERNPLTFRSSTEHSILKNIIASNIFVTHYTAINYDTSRYQELLSCDSYPMLLVSEDETDPAYKVAIMPFSVHYSNITQTPEWLMLLCNIIDYYMPSTLSTNSFEVGESITINSTRGPSLTVKESGETYTSFPAVLDIFAVPGTYTLQQTSYYKKLPDIQIFVKIPAIESNIWRTEDSLAEPYVAEIVDNSYEDLLIWLAAALVAVLFLEWWLQSRENK